MHEFRSAWRGLRSGRSAIGLALVVLAVGTALNTTILALAYGVLVRPLPFEDPSELILVTVGPHPGSDIGIPLSTFEAWESRMQRVDSLAAYSTSQYTLRGLGEPRVTEVALVTGGFFDLLRAVPSRGRSLGPHDAAVVMSESLARELPFSQDDLVNRVVTLAGRSYAVVGILPETMAFPSDRVRLWVLADHAPAVVLSEGESDARRFRLLGRKRPGTSIAQVQEDARRVLDELSRERPRVFARLTASAEGLKERLVAPVRPLLLLFTIASALVLLVSCANAGSALLARASMREQEIAVRLALGAARGRIVRETLTEGLIIAVVGTALGTALSVWAIQILAHSARDLFPRLHEVRIDVMVLFGSLATAGLVALLCGAAPALHALRTDVAPAFRHAAASRPRRAARVSAALVVVQIAASVVLLIGAGLLLRTVHALVRVDAGIEPRNALATTLMLSDSMGFEAASRKPFVSALLRELAGYPGVVHAGIGSSFPPESSMVVVEFTVVDGEREQRSGPFHLVSVTPGHISAMGIPLVAGRLLEEGDEERQEPVALVSQSVARALFGGDEVIDRRLPARLPGARKTAARVVGVVGDVKYAGLDAPAEGAIYVPWADFPSSIVHLAVRTAIDPVAMAPAVRDVIRRVDPGQPVDNIRPVGDVIAGSVADRRLRALLIAASGGLALTLAMLGLVAGLARAIRERRRELAIRTALGSTPTRTIRFVLTDAARLLATGIAIGVAVAILAADGLTAMLFGLTTRDPLTYIGAAAIVSISGIAASAFPSWRATTVNPADLLRSE